MTRERVEGGREGYVSARIEGRVDGVRHALRVELMPGHELSEGGECGAPDLLGYGQRETNRGERIVLSELLPWAPVLHGGARESLEDLDAALRFDPLERRH